MGIKVGDKIRDNIGRTGEVVRVNTSVRVKYDPGQAFTWSGYGLYSEPFNLTVIPPTLPVGTRVRVSDRYDIVDQRGTEGTIAGPVALFSYVWVKVTKPAAHYDSAGIQHSYPASVLDEIKEEPKPKSTFAVGDRVIINGKLPSFKGSEGVVERLTCGVPMVRITKSNERGNPRNGTEWGCIDAWLELAPPAPKFNVGDRVRVTAPGYLSDGFTGVVTDPNAGLADSYVGPVEIKFDRTDHAGGLTGRRYKEKQLELISQPEFKAGDKVTLEATVVGESGDGPVIKLRAGVGTFSGLPCDLTARPDQLTKAGK